jgi:hypothetical protein
MDNMFYKKMAIFLILSAILFFNAGYWHLTWLGFLALGFFLFLASIGLEKYLAIFFGLQDKFCLRILAGFLALVFVASLSGIYILFGHMSPWAIFIIFLAVGLISIVAQKIAQKHPAQNDRIQTDQAEEVAELSHKKYYISIFLLLIFFGLYFLAQSRSSGIYFTPWQTISANYIYLFFLSTLVLGGLIFSSISRRSILILIVIAFLSALAYLPMSHKLFWGADGWRHLAVLEQVKTGGTIEIENFSANGNWLERLNPGLLAYSQFWGALSALNSALDVDLIVLIAWLQPLLAGIILPIILYQLGVVLNFGKRKSLFLAWLGLWPFALHSAGAFTLPVNFGLLIFLIIFLLLIKRMQAPNKYQLPALALLFVFSIFGYSLYLILFALGWIVVEKILYSNKHHSPKIKSALFAGLIIFAILIIPAIEIFAGYARVSARLDYFSSAKQMAGNLTGFYLASGPRPHLIDTGNIFFNQAPSYAFVVNGFTQWRYWLIVFMIFSFLALIFGVRFLKRRGDGADKLIIIFSLGVFFGYIICRYFLAGDHLLSRRLEPTIAVCAIILIFSALHKLFEKKSFFAMFFVFIFSIAITASYSLGPTSRSMSLFEYQSAQNIWQETRGAEKYCVVADTYPLLALEAISAKKIIGGGFPIDKDFGQPELGELYEKMKNDPDDENLWARARELTGANKCFLLAQDKIYTKEFTN